MLPIRALEAQSALGRRVGGGRQPQEAGGGHHGGGDGVAAQLALALLAPERHGGEAHCSLGIAHWERNGRRTILLVVSFVDTGGISYRNDSIFERRCVNSL